MALYFDRSPPPSKRSIEKSSILRELEEALLEQEAPLHAAAVAMAELDATMSLASVAADFGFVRPEVFVHTKLNGFS